jgi:hypothetical protein|tara:strand:- start:770 stop:1042 length:273 start_codon:yes stop_codon:yes gene_type:complete
MAQSTRTKFFDVGIFAEVTQNVDTFGANIYLTQMLSASLERHILLQEEYDDAVSIGNERLASRKEVELEVIESELQMATTMFDFWSESYS